MARLIQKWEALDGSLHDTELAADLHSNDVAFHRWCYDNICRGGEWSAAMVSREILTAWRVAPVGSFWPGGPAGLEPARPRSDQEIVDQTEDLAARLLQWAFSAHLTEGQNFRDSMNARANSCWRMACEIQEMLTHTDVSNAVANLE